MCDFEVWDVFMCTAHSFACPAVNTCSWSASQDQINLLFFYLTCYDHIARAEWSSMTGSRVVEWLALSFHSKRVQMDLGLAGPLMCEVCMLSLCLRGFPPTIQKYKDTKSRLGHVHSDYNLIWFIGVIIGIIRVYKYIDLINVCVWQWEKGALRCKSTLSVFWTKKVQYKYVVEVL